MTKTITFRCPVDIYDKLIERAGRAGITGYILRLITADISGVGGSPDIELIKVLSNIFDTSNAKMVSLIEKQAEISFKMLSEISEFQTKEILPRLLNKDEKLQAYLGRLSKMVKEAGKTLRDETLLKWKDQLEASEKIEDEYIIILNSIKSKLNA